MKSFNLSEWAIKHRSFVWFFMLLFVVAGVLSYAELGREEDPSFSIKTMIVQTYWPGEAYPVVPGRPICGIVASSARQSRRVQGGRPWRGHEL
jgi:Cu/Ag efflux pump CusA